MKPVVEIYEEELDPILIHFKGYDYRQEEYDLLDENEESKIKYSKNKILDELF